MRNAADPVYSVIVPGSLASVFIESLSSPPGPVVLQPSTTSVTIAGAAASVLGPDNQGGVLVLVPSDTPLRTVDVKVAYQLQGFSLTGSTTINCIHSLFGLFTLGFGYGPALARQGSDAQANNLLHPAHPGDFVTLWGTGMGDATPDQVRVLLGGHAALVTYAGPAPGLPGVDQVNFLVPDDPTIPDGCSVALEVDVAEYRSNLSRISKATAPGPCASGTNLSMDQMALLDAGGSIEDVSFFIDSHVLPQRDGSFVRTESFGASSNMLNERLLGPGPLFADDVFYSCAPPGVNARLTDADSFDPGGEGDIGPKIVLTGPSTSSTVPSLAPWLYQLILPPSAPAASPDRVVPSYFAPGSWQVSGGGNSVIEPYQSQISVPPAIQVTNLSNLQTIDVKNDLTVQWDPTGYNPGDVVTLNVTIAALAPIVVCHAHASDGQITVPANLIQIPGATSALFLISVQGSGTRFPIARNDGTTLPGGFDFRFSESFAAMIQSQ
ncbi:MAG TPA: hypothetical protein VEU96_14685 [Bryobacteraceae bacterium]|nr:hypothetical protein [Bryobacteraceae bacterium]